MTKFLIDRQGNVVERFEPTTDMDVVTNIKYMGGCDGNLQSLERVLDGWTVEDIESKLGDIKCGRKRRSMSRHLENGCIWIPVH